MQLDSGQWIIIGLCAVLIAFYAGGYYANRRLAEEVIVWLHNGVKRWGQLTAGGRLGGMATGGRLHIKNANASFQNIEVVFWLTPRENLLFWLFNILRGRHDVLILKIDLHTSPKKDTLMEAGLRHDLNFKKTINKLDIPKSETYKGELLIVQDGKGSAIGERASLFLEKYLGLVTRLSVSKKSPHLTIQLRLKAILQQSSEKFFTDLNDLCSS